MRRRRIAGWLAGAMALMLAWQVAAAVSSNADSSSASARTWLTDAGQGKALFPADVRFAPGRPYTACLSVQGGDAAADDVVTLQASDVTGPLAARLGLTVSVGTGTCTTFTGTQIYSGTLSGLALAQVNTGWAPGASQQRLFRFVALLPADETEQEVTSHASFVWRLTSTPPTPVKTPTPPATSPATAPTTAPTTAPVPPVSETAGSEPTQAPTPTSPDADDPGGDGQDEAGSTPGTGTQGTVPTTGPRDGTTLDDDDPTGTASPTDDLIADPAGGSGTGTGAGEPKDKADVSLFASTPKKLAQVLTSAVQDKTGLLLWPLIVAALFMIGQYWIDRYDPKLARASRSRKDLSVIFPVRYGTEGAQP